jgi:hypothetical protein
MVSIAFFQVPGLLREKRYRELLGFTLMWVVAGGYAAAVAANIPLPTVIDVLGTIYSRIPVLQDYFKW